MRRLRRLVDRALAGALIAIMGVMVVNVLWQVVTRFVLRAPSSYTEELARFLLIWLSLLGGAYVAGQGLHLAIDLLPQRLQGGRRRQAAAIVNGAVLLFALGAMVIGGVRLVYLSFALQQISAALQVSLGYVYLVVPLSGILIVFYGLTSMIAPDEPDDRDPAVAADRSV